MQVLLPAGSSSPLLAEMPAALRTAEWLRTDPAVGRVIIVAGDAEFVERWRERASHLDGVEIVHAPGDALRRQLDGRLSPEPVAVLCGDGMPGPEALRAWSATDGRPISWFWEERSVAATYPNPEALYQDCLSFEATLHPSRAHAARLSRAGWQPLTTEQDRRRAEQRLFDSLRKPTDGYIARFDRSLSIAISKRLLRTRVTPNEITSAGLVLGLLGSALLAFGSYAGRVAGLGLLWLVCVLDGCDGEIARLKLLSSPRGARYDLIADHLVHVATFAAIVVALRRLNADVDWLPLSVVLLTGVGACMLAVWQFALRSGSDEGSAGLPPAFERIASGDFVYILFLFTAIDRLPWFAWAAAVGSHVFWIALCACAFVAAPES